MKLPFCVCVCVCVCVWEREREREREGGEREILSSMKIFIDFHAIRCEPYATEDRYNTQLLVLNLLIEVPRTYFKN